ncbi:sensor histidine kinase [Candidatus Nitrospira bockiana]
MTSFRGRIRHLTLALIVLLLVAFDLTVYWGFQGVLNQYVDSRLTAMAESWADIAARNLAMLLEASQKGQEAAVPTAVQNEGEQIELREAALSIQLLSLDGSVLWKGAAAVTDPPRDSAFLESIRRGDRVIETVSDPAGDSIRRIWVPIRKGHEVRYLLQVETPMRLMEKALNWLAAILTAASALVFLVAWFGSNWLARQALIPVEALSATAQRISEPSSLGTRLVLDAPYTEFRRLAQAFNTMMDRIQRVVESQRRFIADAAHEIQTPLTSLKGNLEVSLRQHREAADYREALISNLGAVDRLINLSRSLLTLARLVEPESPASYTTLSLEPILKDLVEELTVLAQDKGVELKLMSFSAPLVRGSQEQLERVFLNLLDNAFRHTDSGGTIEVRLDRDHGDAVIAVVDTGVGIPAEHLPYLFERFYRVDRARSEDSGGVGLGLAIVKEIIVAHQGSISVSSELGKGTTVTIRLPSGDCR